MKDLVPSRDDWFKLDHGLPHPDWRKIGGWIRATVAPKDTDLAYQQAVRIWLSRLGAGLGGKYAISESEHFHLLAPADIVANGTLQFLENARKTILRVVGDQIRQDGTAGKHVVIRFATHEAYFQYASRYTPDGHQASSSGMFIRNGGYMHIIHPPQFTADVVRSVLAHELTHNLLWMLPLPVWLNEALAMSFEQDLSGRGMPELNGELERKHRAYWNAETIQQFWYGHSFHSVKGQELSYNLAAILIRIIANDIRPSPEDFRRFVLRADWIDAGMNAATEHLGHELEDIAATFLGPGDWRPKPETWKRGEFVSEEAEDEEVDGFEEWQDEGEEGK